MQASRGCKPACVPAALAGRVASRAAPLLKGLASMRAVGRRPP